MQKKLKGLRKKLRDIADLEAKKEQGEKLSAEQKEKVVCGLSTSSASTVYISPPLAIYPVDIPNTYQRTLNSRIIPPLNPLLPSLLPPYCPPPRWVVVSRWRTTSPRWKRRRTC